MNYYDHHIGDYDEATSHLSAVEDGIYSRLIRKYYATEKPLVADVEKLQRLVRARSKEEKQAVVDMLAEFFELQDDGWHQSTCDEVIVDYQAGEPERVLKKENEHARMKRHRDERARLFKLLHSVGEHALWNVSMADLRALVKRHCPTETPACNAPATPTGNVTGVQPATEPATPLTATQSPLPNPHTPKIEVKAAPSGRPKSTPRKPKTGMPEGFCVSEAVAKWAKERGLDRLDEHLEVFVRKVAANGYVYADWDRAFQSCIAEDWGKLRQSNGKVNGNGNCNGNGSQDDWFRSGAGVMRKAKELGVNAPPGISMEDLKDKCFARIREPQGRAH